jgi:HAD superfamily hydrolase (TIGR01509 family)
MKKAILYDMGDIFFESHFWRKWMWESLCEQSVFSGSFKDFYMTYERVLEPVYDGRVRYREAYNAFVKSLKLKDPDTFIKESFEKKLYYETHRDLYVGVKETLAKIQARGIQNIVISDNESGEKKIRDTILTRFEINDSIDFVYSSKELQNRKPHPDVFKHVLDAHGLKKEEVYFVAHDQDEIDGAIEFGIEVIEFNNYLGWETKAILKVRDFGGIFGVVDGGSL